MSECHAADDRPFEKSEPRHQPTPFGSVDRESSRENAGILCVVAPMVAIETVENGCERLNAVGDADPDLARLVRAWPVLPATVRRMLLAVLDAGQEADG